MNLDALPRIEAAASLVIEAGAIPIGIGGDGRVSLALMRAVGLDVGERQLGRLRMGRAHDLLLGDAREQEPSQIHHASVSAGVSSAVPGLSSQRRIVLTGILVR